MAMIKRRPMPPVIFNSREATYLLDLIVDRLATMSVVDREDAAAHLDLVCARRKIEEAIESAKSKPSPRV